MNPESYADELTPEHTPGERKGQRPWQEILRPAWKPGQSGNPNGRPKGAKSIKTTLREMLELKASRKDMDRLRRQGVDVPDDLAKLLTQQDLIAISMLTSAKRGKPNATQQVLERVWGKVVDKQQVSMPDAIVMRMPDGTELMRLDSTQKSDDEDQDDE